MKYTYTDADKLPFENASDVRLIDDDSNLRLFRGMISPWDAIKSFKETFYFQTRSADTNVRLRDGETMVIGGLIGSEEAQRLSKIPFLGDLPVLGHFFRHTSKSRTESELLIFLKARILDDKDMIVSDTERIEEEANGNKNTDSR